MATKTTTAFESAYQKLNEGQRKAVDTIDGPVMVLAGPGTGKTQTLTVRIGNILQKTQLDPWNILCLTFTESAAAEMRERLASLIGPSAYHVHISTFHSFCNSVIEEHPELFAISSDFRPLADVERVQMIQDILDSLPGTSALKPFGAPYLYLKDCSSHIQTLKQEDISPEAFKETLKRLESFVKAVHKDIESFVATKPGDRTDADCEKILKVVSEAAKKHELPQLQQDQLQEIATTFAEQRDAAEGKREASKARTACKNSLHKFFSKISNSLARQQELQKVYVVYQKELQKQGRYDFEDMIILVVEELKNNEDLLADLQETFQYVLVDEFQDTNGAQNEVVALLANYDDTPNVFVVGDDKQSIYRFQGASLANMMMFYERYKDSLSVISLTENYRSQSNVLNAAASVIEKSTHLLANIVPGVEATLHPASGLPSKKFTQYVAESEDHEVKLLADGITKLLSDGTPASEVAVLVRFNKDAAEVAATLRKHNVPASLASGENALKNHAVQQWLEVWRYIANPARYDSLLSRIVQFDWWGIESLDGLKATRAAGDTRLSLTRAFSDTDLLQKAGASNPEAIVKLIQKLGSWHKQAANTTVSNFVTSLLEDSGWLSSIASNEKRLFELEHMSTVLQVAKDIDTRRQPLSLQDFIEVLDMHVRHDVALMTPERKLGKNTVTVMTAHKAKGLEFEHVFLPRMVDKTWGNTRAPYKLSLPDGLVQGDVVAEGEHEEDERRLFYVAITRAKKTLTFSRAKMKSGEKLNVPSLYLLDIPGDVLETQEVVEAEGATAERLTAELSSQTSEPNIREWIQGLLEGYVLSVTHLNHYLEDPALFYERHILRIPSVRTPYQAMGTAAHNALDDFFKEFKGTGKIPKKDYVISQFEQYLEREALTDQEYKDALAVGKKELGAYYDFYKSSFAVDTLGEYDFRSHNVRVEGVPITGKIDKLEMLGDKKVNVVDYKTGSPERGLTKLKPGEKGDYFRQIVFYKLLCEHSPKFEYEMVSGEVDFIRPNKSGEFVKKKLQVTDKDMAELTETIKRVWSEIQELKFLG